MGKIRTKLIMSTAILKLKLNIYIFRMQLKLDKNSS